jgi:hypothetical protein
MSNKDVKIHEVVEKVSMKDPIEIEQFSNPWLTLTFCYDNSTLIF